VRREDLRRREAAGRRPILNVDPVVRDQVGPLDVLLRPEVRLAVRAGVGARAATGRKRVADPPDTVAADDGLRAAQKTRSRAIGVDPRALYAARAEDDAPNTIRLVVGGKVDVAVVVDDRQLVSCSVLGF
jgi:hypothetical protein